MDLVGGGTRRPEDLAAGRKLVQVEFGWVDIGWNHMAFFEVRFTDLHFPWDEFHNFSKITRE